MIAFPTQRNGFIRSVTGPFRLWWRATRRDLWKLKKRTSSPRPIGVEYTVAHILVWIYFSNVVDHAAKYIGRRIRSRDRRPHRGHSVHIATDVSVIAAAIVMLIGLMFWARCVVWQLLVCYHMLQTYCVLIGLLVVPQAVWGRPASVPRSIILMGFNAIQFIAGFATLYLGWNALSTQPSESVDWISALYFSTASFTTQSYGGLEPRPGGAMLLTVVEMLVSVTFLVVILAAFVSRLSSKLGSSIPSVRRHLEHHGRASAPRRWGVR